MSDQEVPSPINVRQTAADSELRLITRLQQAGGALADAQSSEEVFRIILGPWLGAVSSTILLLDASGRRFGYTESWGAGQSGISGWQTGTPDSESPATQVLQTRQALFIEQVSGQDPNRDVSSGDSKVVAGAALPLFLQTQPLGTLVFEFGGPRQFTQEETQFLLALAAQTALALGRTQLLETLEQRVQERTAALNAFVQYTESADGATDLPTLAQKAVDLLGQHFPGCTGGYYVLEDNLWKLKIHSADLNDTPELLALITSGLAVDTPVFANAVLTGAPVFVDVWDEAQGRIDRTEAYQSIGTFPLIFGGTTHAVFAIGLRDALTWTNGGQAIVRAVARSLNLALERTEQMRQLTSQRDLLDARTQLLAAANHDMEAFAYSVSHDLRTPVRHILGFKELLSKALNGRLDNQTARYLQVVGQAAERMNTLIDAMLNLSRSTSAPLRLGRVDLEALVWVVRQDLEGEVIDRQVSWQVSPLPAVTGDQETLRQVLTNLISNALKYTRHQPEPTIEIWGEDQDERWTVYVRDNGVGFNPDYQDRLFGVFQRLHSEKDFEGTGVGLAMVKRIVLKHEGQVFARSQPGHGATFGFTLPKRRVD